MDQVFRDNRPPPAGPKMPIIRLKGSESRDFLILSTEVNGFWSHWTGRCTIECTLPHENCRGHQLGFPSKWKGYLHVYEWATKKQGFLELTPALAEQLEMQVGQRKNCVRGMSVKVERSRANNGRVKLLVTNIATPKEAGMIDEVDPLPAVRILWGYVGHRENGGGI